MSFPINTTVPNINNDPADDVAPMNQNFVNINGFLSVDHVAPGAIGNGFHQQITYNALTTPAAPPGNPTGPFGIAYCKAGGLQPTVGQNYWINDKGFFPMSAIRAVGQFTTVAALGLQTLSQNVNVTVLDHLTQNNYRFTITTNAVFSTNPIVLTSFTPNATGVNVGYSYSGGILTIGAFTQSVFSPVTINFVVLEI